MENHEIIAINPRLKRIINNTSNKYYALA